jgi:Slime mold cyclic AMP receptor
MERRPDLLDTSSCLLFLAVCDCVLAIIAVVDGAQVSCFSSELCWFKACMSQFFCISGFMWTAAMSHSSYTGVKQLFTAVTQDASKLMIRYHILCWGLPLMIVGVMFATSTPISTGYPCAPSPSAIAVPGQNYESPVLPTTAWLIIIQLALYVAPLVATEGFNLYVFRFLVNTLRRMPASNDLLTRFSKYLAVVLGARIVLLLQRLIFIISPDTQMYPLLFFAALGPPLQGLGDYFILQSSKEHNRFTQISGTESRSLAGGSAHGTQSLVRSNDTHNHDNDNDQVEIEIGMQIRGNEQPLQMQKQLPRPRLLLGGAFEIVGEDDEDADADHVDRDRERDRRGDGMEVDGEDEGRLGADTRIIAGAGVTAGVSRSMTEKYSGIKNGAGDSPSNRLISAADKGDDAI